MSNKNYNLSLKAKAEWEGQSTEFDFDPYNDCTDMDGLRDYAIENVTDDFDVEEEDEPDFSTIKVSIEDYDEVPDKWANEEDVWEFAEAFAECEQELEVVESALECGVSAKDIDEAYQGSYKNDEDFAQETAESLGAVDKDATWPRNCIDWEYAAKELMYDYSEHNGHYFRNL